jgi:hypothetical protein
MKLSVIFSIISFAYTLPQDQNNLYKRQSPVQNAINGIQSALSPVSNGGTVNAAQASGIYNSIISDILAVVGDNLTPTPTDISQMSAVFESTWSSSTSTTFFFDGLVKMAGAGLAPSGNILANLLSGLASYVDEFGTLLTGGTQDAQNSKTNINLRNPVPAAYPKRLATDPSYSLTEAQLRQVIYIPSTFTYGQKPPVILVPGTGATGYQSFSGNFIPLLTNVDFADPVWLNIPMQLGGDTQVNAEYVAYAINYINGITSRNVSVIGWSQGPVITQWALKYWSSTRSVVSNLIADAPDFKGSISAYNICPGGLLNLPCAPALDQQESGSNFIATLRNNGGDSAYVPTTVTYTRFDPVAFPEFGLNPTSATSIFWMLEMLVLPII